MDFKRGIFIAAFLVLFIGLVSADSNNIYSNCSIFGNCQPAITKSTGGNTTIFNNNSYFNITGNNSEPNWNGNYSTVFNYFSNGTFYLASNPSGYITNANTSGLIQNWGQILNGTGLIKDWTYLGTNSSYYLFLQAYLE